MAKLKLNASKTKVIFIDKNRGYGKSHLCRNNVLYAHEIETANSFKYLGFIIQSNLKFTNQLNKCVKNVSYKISVLSKVRHCINRKTGLTISKSMTLPYVQYAKFLYSCTLI